MISTEIIQLARKIEEETAEIDRLVEIGRYHDAHDIELTQKEHGLTLARWVLAATNKQTN